ncbi:MAG: DNA-3-methyladenine glycosylase I [Alphaproteobacteria bacterium]|nr:DNA-3-methyladenine glycosylase I [Alphaproteobacteria bacterium]
MPHYCDIAPHHPVHAEYHNTEYGFPTKSERVLFERLSLEIMQAGLSWETILKKRKALNKAFDRFVPAKVASYGAKDIKRLMGDKDIIRNRLKITSIIHNAKQVMELRKTDKGFSAWLLAHHPKSKEDWTKLFRRQFKFMGSEIVGEFLMSTGYLPGAHRKDCQVYIDISAIIRKNRRSLENKRT